MSRESGHYAAAELVSPRLCPTCQGSGRTPGKSSVHGPYPDREDAVAKAFALLATGCVNVSVWHLDPNAGDKSANRVANDGGPVTLDA